MKREANAMRLRWWLTHIHAHRRGSSRPARSCLILSRSSLARRFARLAVRRPAVHLVLAAAVDGVAAGGVSALQPAEYLRSLLVSLMRWQAIFADALNFASALPSLRGP